MERALIAVAYATSTGVDALERCFGETTVRAAAWQRLEKRWLVGSDWFRTEPEALDRLSSLPNSQVHIFDGDAVVARPGSCPRIPCHPKTFIFAGPSVTAVVHG